MKLLNIVLGIFYVIFGIYLWNNPAETLVTYSLYLGLIHLFGAIALLVYTLIKKLKPIPWGNIVVSLFIGVVILFLPLISLTFLLWLFVFSFLAVSIYYLRALLKNKEQKWRLVQIVIAGAGVLYGVIMLINPIAGFATMAKCLAFGVITNGVAYIFSKE